MELELLEKLKKIQKDIIKYIDQDDDSDENFQNIKKILDESKFTNNKDNFRLIIRFISNISSNYHRGPFLISKIEKILLHLKDNITHFLTVPEIFKIFVNNKRILLFLFEEKIITMNQYIYDELKSIESYEKYFSIEIQEFLKTTEKEELEANFEDKRKIGENDNYICQLIRNDSVEEFISYCNKINLPVNSCIEHSIYETNSYFFNKKRFRSIRLIDYAAFFGSIQIFRYLKNQGAKLKRKLWYCAIHSKNPELIHLIEENEIRFPSPYFVRIEDDYLYSLKESIKCHHNDIANYIIDAYSNQKFKEYEVLAIISSSIEFCNFDFIQKEIDLDIDNAFYYFCNYEYYDFVDILIKKGIDVNRKMIYN